MTARIASIVALLAAAVAALLIGRNEQPSVTVEAVLRDARGLVRGADVTVAGRPVGRVTRVRLGSDGLPHVTLRVHGDLHLGRGTRAAMRLASQSGEFNRYVALLPGRGALLRPPLRLGLGQTASPVEVDEALSALDPATRADVRTTLRGLRGALDATGPANARTLKSTPAALHELAGVLDDVSADGAALRTLVRASRAVTATLATRPGDLQDALRSTRLLLQTTAVRQHALRDALAELPAGLRAPRRALQVTRAALPDLRGLISDARPVAARLGSSARALRGTLTAAGPAARQARALTATAAADLRALTPLLHEATPLLAALTPVLRRAGPILDHARVRLPDFFSFFSNWADFTANYDASGHGARVGLVLPPAPTTVLSPSGNGPGQLRAPYLRTPGALEGEPWRSYAGSFVAGASAAPDVAPQPDPVTGGR